MKIQVGMTDMRFHEGQVGSKDDRGDVKLCNCKEARHTILYLDDILTRGTNCITKPVHVFNNG